MVRVERSDVNLSITWPDRRNRDSTRSANDGDTQLMRRLQVWFDFDSTPFDSHSTAVWPRYYRRSTTNDKNYMFVFLHAVDECRGQQKSRKNSKHSSLDLPCALGPVFVS